MWAPGNYYFKKLSFWKVKVCQQKALGKKRPRHLGSDILIVIIHNRMIKVHMHPLTYDRSYKTFFCLKKKKINISVRADVDHKYFREAKKYGSYSGHTGCTSYDQAILKMENCHQPGFVNSVEYVWDPRQLLKDQPGVKDGVLLCHRAWPWEQRPFGQLLPKCSWQNVMIQLFILTWSLLLTLAV